MNQSSVLTRSILGLPRFFKRLLALATDVFLCVFTLWIALSLRLEEPVRLNGIYLFPLFLSIGLAIPLFVMNGMYRAIFRFVGRNALMAVVQSIGIYGLAYALLFTVIGVNGVPRSIGVSQPLMLFIAVGGSRAFVRYWLGGLYSHILQQKKSTSLLIYGAGAAGRQLVVTMRGMIDKRVVGFLDDNQQLQGNYVNGLEVFNPAELSSVIKEKSVREILLALPATDRTRRNEILHYLLQHPVHVRTLPSVSNLLNGRVRIEDLQELDIEDLLGRDPVTPEACLLNQNTRNKTVLVTGAGGSIGSELCRQILKCAPCHLLLVERNEFALYTIYEELRGVAIGTELVPLLASAGDRHRMDEIMSTWRPETVYHAAAYKHVPLVEHNPGEGLKNNVWGTWTCAHAALAHGVERFILISTDKAVRPTNIMGASKRLAELVLQGLSGLDKGVGGEGAPMAGARTCFSMVRFGNVLGSSGSVVPLFRKQIKSGGPITLTHPEITRYFMTIPEAAQLVIQAGAMAQGGDVFVLDMGQPVRIIDLARRMVALSGLTLRDHEHSHGDIEIEITGLRPGEKLYEELLIGDDPNPTNHPRIMKAQEAAIPWRVLERKLKDLYAALDVNDVPLVKTMLEELVQGYQPEKDVVDWVYLEQEQNPLHDDHESFEHIGVGKDRREAPECLPVSGISDLFVVTTTDERDL